MSRRRCVRWLVAVAGVVGLCGCGSLYLTAQLSPDLSLYPVSRIAVLPVVPESGDPGAEQYRTGRVAPGAEEVLTQALYNAFDQWTHYQLVDPAVVGREVAAQAEPPTTSAALQSLATQLGADAIMRGVVSLYRERDGSHLGVTQPAAVGIDLWLVSRRDGKVIWHGRYYEAQQSMMEELRTIPLYWKRGMGWLTAKELATYAVSALVKTLPQANPGTAPTSPGASSLGTVPIPGVAGT